MSMEALFVSLALLGAVIASATDIKAGVIPNRLSLFLIGFGILGHFFYSIYMRSFELLFLAMQNAAIIFAVGYLFWLLGGWSAGDVKEFIFLAVLVPQYPKFLLPFFKPAVAGYPFILTIFFNTIVAIFPFVMIYSICISYSRVGLAKFMEPLKNLASYAKKAFVVAGCISAGVVFNLYLGLVLLLLSSLGFREAYKLGISLVFVLFAALNGQAAYILRYFVILTGFFAGFGFFWNSLNILRTEALRDRVRITELKEGDVLAEEFYKDGDKIIRNGRGMIQKIKEAVKTGDFQALRRRKVVSTHASGLDIEEIKLLQKYVAEGKLDNEVKISKSMPFAPSILLGLVISLIFGDVILYVQEAL